MLNKSRAKYVLYGVEYISLIVGIIIVWQSCVSVGWVNTVVLPSPATILDRFQALIASGDLGKQIIVSLVRVLKGFVLAALAGISLGVVIGLSPRCFRITDLLIQLVRPIPAIAWIPLVILWFGIGEESKVFLIFLGGFFVILINMIDGVHHIDGKLLEVARVLETPRLKYVTQVIIPAVLPSIFTSLRLGMGACWTCVVAAELVASTTGLGYMIMNARQFSQTPVVIVGILTIGIIGKITDSLLRAAEKRVISWRR